MEDPDQLLWGHWQRRGGSSPGTCCDVTLVTGTRASGLGTGASHQAHSHSQLGWQGGPVDPVPALGASPGPHPGILGDWVSAQKVLREKSKWSLLSGLQK